MRSCHWGSAIIAVGLLLPPIVACGPGELVLGDRKYGSPDGSVIDNVFGREDASRDKNRSDMGGIRPPSDAGQADDSAPNGPMPDGPMPDGPMPDGPMPDGPTPDAPVPDSRLPDAGIPFDAPPPPPSLPNVILLMADDMGWGDTGYNGHSQIQTPHLDQIAKAGVRFERFYAAAPVCSPTRGSAITGRHPFRYGVVYANEGHLKHQELSLAEALKTLGYTTGHFGKWHLGTLTRSVKDGKRGGRPEWHHDYSPPWDNGFDVCLSAESGVPTWNPMVDPTTQMPPTTPTRYWTGPGSWIPTNHASLEGDDSRVIMDRVLPFVRDAVRNGTPFLAVVWFHTPHAPVVAGPDYLQMYADRGVANKDKQHYYGCITAMDQQIGRLRQELRRLGARQNTMLFFSSDNGPEGNGSTGRSRGSTKGLRGRKRSLYEGGVRVPGLLEWPARVTKPVRIKAPCSTSDYLPTILSALGASSLKRPKPGDGIDLLPIITGKQTQRPVPIAFESRKYKNDSHHALALTDNRYKLISQDDGNAYELYDLIIDPSETTDLAQQKPSLVAGMKAKLDAWQASCDNSLTGADY